MNFTDMVQALESAQEELESLRSTAERDTKELADLRRQISEKDAALREIADDAHELAMWPNGSFKEECSKYCRRCIAEKALSSQEANSGEKCNHEGWPGNFIDREGKRLCCGEQEKNP